MRSETKLAPPSLPRSSRTRRRWTPSLRGLPHHHSLTAQLDTNDTPYRLRISNKADVTGVISPLNTPLTGSAIARRSKQGRLLGSTRPAKTVSRMDAVAQHQNIQDFTNETGGSFVISNCSCREPHRLAPITFQLHRARIEHTS